MGTEYSVWALLTNFDSPVKLVHGMILLQQCRTGLGVLRNYYGVLTHSVGQHVVTGVSLWEHVALLTANVIRRKLGPLLHLPSTGCS